MNIKNVLRALLVGCFISGSCFFTYATDNNDNNRFVDYYRLNLFNNYNKKTAQINFKNSEKYNQLSFFFAKQVIEDVILKKLGVLTEGGSVYKSGDIVGGKDAHYYELYDAYCSKKIGENGVEDKEGIKVDLIDLKSFEKLGELIKSGDLQSKIRNYNLTEDEIKEVFIKIADMLSTNVGILENELRVVGKELNRDFLYEEKCGYLKKFFPSILEKIEKRKDDLKYREKVLNYVNLKELESYEKFKVDRAIRGEYPIEVESAVFDLFDKKNLIERDDSMLGKEEKRRFNYGLFRLKKEDCITLYKRDPIPVSDLKIDNNLLNEVIQIIKNIEIKDFVEVEDPIEKSKDAWSKYQDHIYSYMGYIFGLDEKDVEDIKKDLKQAKEQMKGNKSFYELGKFALERRYGEGKLTQDELLKKDFIEKIGRKFVNSFIESIDLTLEEIEKK